MNTMRSAALYVLVIALGVLGGGSLWAADSLRDKVDPKVITIPGRILTYSAGDSAEKGYEPWRHLQRFQVHLRELDTGNKLDVVGCETGEELRSCDDLESAIRGNQPKGTRKIKTLVYQVYDSDWNSGVRELFDGALTRTNAETQTGVPWVELKVSSVAANFPEPACEQYSQPCYSRAICTAFGGCSKSKYSCLQCNP